MKHLFRLIFILALAVPVAWADEVTDFDTTAGNNTGDDWGMKENIAPSDVNDNYREAIAIIARWYEDWRGTVISYGSANAIRITPTRTISALEDGLMMALEVTTANTATVTLQISSLAAKEILKAHDVGLVSGDLESGQKIIVVYNSNEDKFQLLTLTASNTLTDPMTTRGDIVIRNTSNVTARLAVGTTDSFVLKSDGTDPSWNTVAVFNNLAVFVTGGTWTKPGNLVRIKVTVIGAGGGGAGAASTAAGSGGSGGGTCIEILEASELGATETVTVGTAGAAGAAGGDNAGTIGGTSNFGSLCSATGGSGGTTGGSANSSGAGSGGDLNIRGGAGQTVVAGATNPGGAGGSTFMGGGGAGTSSSAGEVGGAYGGGGAGGSNNNAGGIGADGVVIVEEFY